MRRSLDNVGRIRMFDIFIMIKPVRKAVELLRWHNVTPIRYSCYVLIKDEETALERIKFLKGMNVDPFVQAYIDQSGTEPLKILKDFTRTEMDSPISNLFLQMKYFKF